MSAVSKYKKYMRCNTVFSNFLNLEKETHRVRDRRETERYRDDNCISLEPQSKGGMSLVHVSK